MFRRIYLFMALALLASSAGLLLHAIVRNPMPAISFYHWKTVYAPGPLGQNALRSTQSPRLYLRFFDVVLGEYMAEPVATAVFIDRPALPLVPVVFIDEPVMRQSHYGDPGQLARRIVQRVQDMLRENDLTPAGELQLDCDWTAGSRENFFALVAELKKAVPPGWTVSVTLRLSQYRDAAETGIPPADRAALMLYNMGQLRVFGEHNSILDPAIAGHYLKGVKYPLPLDVALPLFSWGVLFDREKNYRGLARELPADLNDPAVFEKVSPLVYRALKPVQWSGNRLYTGEYLRLEQSALKDVEKVAALAGESLGHVDTVIFYHLDDAVLGAYPVDFPRRVAARLR